MKKTILFSSVLLLAAIAFMMTKNQPSTPAADWTSRAIAEIAAHEYIFHYSDELQTWQCFNRRHHLQFIYQTNGFSVRPWSANEQPGIPESGADWQIDFRLTGLGRNNGILSPAGEGSWQVSGGEALLHRENLDLHYQNSAQGLRQNFIITNRPVGEGDLRLRMDTNSELGLSVFDQGLVFKDSSAADRLQYADLNVWDAEMRIMAAHFEPAGPAGFDIVIDDDFAVYPLTIDPLSTNPDWSGEPNQANASYGFSVARAGDVNNDGYSDVIIGAYRHENGAHDGGTVFGFYGSASGLSTTPNWITDVDNDGAWFGWAVASAGDVNNDGYDDVIVGAVYYANQFGGAFVYLGSASGLATSPVWSAQGDQDGCRFGISVASAGDVNNDGYDEVIVGARLYISDNGKEGRAYLYMGSAAGPSATADWIGEANQTSAEYGYRVASAGDVNADGYDDVMVSARLFDDPEYGEGKVFLYYGASGGLNTSPGWTADGDQASVEFGKSINGAGDVNNDGFDDIIIGSIYFSNGESHEGRAFVYMGSASGPSLNPDWTAEADQADAFFGAAVASAGDVNGDGFDDVIVGAYGFDGDLADEGKAYVYHGSLSGLSVTPDWTAESNQTGCEYAIAVSSAGDVNNDGFAEVLVGADLYDNGQADEGGAFLYMGSEDDPLPVELVSFTAAAGNEGVVLNWSTASELNNYGFEIYRSSQAGTAGEKIAFVRGNGNSSAEEQYSYLDQDVLQEQPGTWYYHLKQIDFDGQSQLSPVVSVEIPALTHFELSQNYPNPFSAGSGQSASSTTIPFTLSETGSVHLEVFNTLGQKMLVSSKMSLNQGNHQIRIDASDWPGGVYFYRLQVTAAASGQTRFSQQKKMLLLR